MKGGGTEKQDTLSNNVLVGGRGFNMQQRLRRQRKVGGQGEWQLCVPHYAEGVRGELSFNFFC